MLAAQMGVVPPAPESGIMLVAARKADESAPLRAA